MSAPNQQGAGDTLAQILVQVAVIGEQLKVVPDHERRLRRLEWLWYTVAVPGSASAGAWLGMYMSRR